MTAPLALVDTHAHLDDHRLKGRMDEVLRAAREAGVVQVISVATTAEDSASVAELARVYPGVFAAVGIHPNEAIDAVPGDWDRIRTLADRPEVVAIGETGLDRHWDRTPFPLQVESFERHLDLAEELGLPIIIHSRDCHRDIVDQLGRRRRAVRGVLHSFTGTWTDAEELLGLGLHISFAGMLTFANRSLDPLREAASRVPVDRLLVETDAPYLSPHPHRGRTNEPARVAITAAKMAEIRGLSPIVLANLTTDNARRLFGLSPDQTLRPS